MSEEKELAVCKLVVDMVLLMVVYLSGMGTMVTGS